MKELKDYVRSIPDFPEPGIIFRDVTTILQDPDGLVMSIDGLRAELKGLDYDLILGPESRGFIFGVPVAYVEHKAFIPVRKKGKLPCETVSMDYDLEYGKATIEIHKDAIKPGDKVVIIDDLIATGGTIEAITKLVESLGGEIVKIVFVMELEGLKGREKLSKYNAKSLASILSFSFNDLPASIIPLAINVPIVDGTTEAIFMPALNKVFPTLFSTVFSLIRSGIAL